MNSQSRAENPSCEEIIERYFKQGFDYQKILCFLYQYHGIRISLRTLNTKLHYLGLKRKNINYNLDNVKTRIQQELDGPGCSGGYRAVWHTLRIEGMQVPRDVVRVILKELDPQGVQQRKSKTLRRRIYHTPGPNYTWHVDGYDKLKPYGFPVHGCIDGYSRKVLWFKVCRTNNDPAVIGHFFLNAVKEFGGCPTVLRTDNGTENTILAAIQSYFRCDGDDEFAGEKSHRYGTSPSNQRIECWWSYLRKNRSSWWMNFFKDLVEIGQLCLSNQLQKECLWFCFSELLQSDFTSVQLHWNTHYIRKSRFETVAGRPDEMFFLPECTGVQNHIKYISDEKFHDMSEYCNGYIEESLYQEYFAEIAQQLSFAKPTNWREALDQYNRLCQISQGME